MNMDRVKKYVGEYSEAERNLKCCDAIIEDIAEDMEMSPILEIYGHTIEIPIQKQSGRCLLEFLGKLKEVYAAEKVVAEKLLKQSVEENVK